MWADMSELPLDAQERAEESGRSERSRAFLLSLCWVATSGAKENLKGKLHLVQDGFLLSNLGWAIRWPSFSDTWTSYEVAKAGCRERSGSVTQLELQEIPVCSGPPCPELFLESSDNILSSVIFSPYKLCYKWQWCQLRQCFHSLTWEGRFFEDTEGVKGGIHKLLLLCKSLALD